MTEFLAVAFITILAIISPGADFAMVTHNSLLHGWCADVLCALDTALGVRVRAFYTIFGVGLLIAHAPTLLYDIKLIGVAYLVQIGWKTLSVRPLPSGETVGDSVDILALSTFAILCMGFLTNVSNPETTLFVVNTYTQVVHANTPLFAQFGYSLLMSAVYVMWFVLVAAALVSGALRRSPLARQHIADGVIDVIPIRLGLVLGPAWFA